MRIFVALSLIFIACAHGEAAGGALADWRAAYPDASRDLCLFARDYPEMANRVRDWMREHPAQAEELLDWAADNPGAPAADEFVASHPDWGGTVPWRDPALYILFDWASTNAAAARQLVETHRTALAIDTRGGC